MATRAGYPDWIAGVVCGLQFGLSRRTPSVAAERVDDGWVVAAIITRAGFSPTSTKFGRNKRRRMPAAPVHRSYIHALLNYRKT
jgi:hypothetical protein